MLPAHLPKLLVDVVEDVGARVDVRKGLRRERQRDAVVPHRLEDLCCGVFDCVVVLIGGGGCLGFVVY